jgi:polyketide cyclase/dehydrase/lipid transport protein
MGRPRRRAIFWGAAAVAGLAPATLWLWGTWASSEAKNPGTSSEGAVTRLYRTPDGRTVVRSAIVIDRPVDPVWKGMTDPTLYAAMFPEAGLRAEVEEGGRIHVTHPKVTAAGRWTVDLHLRREESPSRRALVWDDPSAEVPVNRGDWSVTPLDADRTLLVALLEVELAKCPNALLRALMLRREGPILERVALYLSK